MTDKKISDLTDATELQDTDELIIRRASGNFAVSAELLKQSTMIANGGLGMIVNFIGNWYPPYVQADVSGNSSLGTGTTNAQYIPMFINQTINVDALGVRVMTAQASSNIRMGLYRGDGVGGRPKTLIVDAGTQSGATTGDKEFTFTAETLTPGLYWIVISFDNAGLVIQAYNNPRQAAHFGDSSITNATNFSALAGGGLNSSPSDSQGGAVAFLADASSVNFNPTDNDYYATCYRTSA